MKIIYTTGVFDVLHKGHFFILQYAKSLGDMLIVGIQDDESVEKQKGMKPVLSCEERMAALRALPFIDECVPYHDLDQRIMLQKIKPNVMVQTEEWQKQTDRNDIIEYLNKELIDLVIVPITKDISSTEIKKRIKEQEIMVRKDCDIVSQSLTMLPIQDIALYEQYDEKRVHQLCEKMQTSQTFFNPITVGKYEDHYILIDGANRYEALKRIGASYVFAHIVDYTNKAEVELSQNMHFLTIDFNTLKDAIITKGLSYVLISKEEYASVSSKRIVMFFGDNTYIAIIPYENDITGIETINAVVSCYIGLYPVARLSELNHTNDSEYSVHIRFPRLTPEQIVSCIQKNQWIASGVTWHKVKQIIVRFHVPISILCKQHDDQTYYQVKEWLQKKITEKIKKGSVRAYTASHVYLCDEWK